MAAGDATFVPRRNTAFRVTFPILDGAGNLVAAAAGLDSEVSKDGGTFADATAEATEIATSSGIYFLDLTATEMDADTVAIQVKTTSTGAKPTVLVLYTATRDVDDLAYPTTTGRSIDVTAGGEVGVDLDNASGTLDAAQFGADAFTAAKFAADVTTELQAGLATATALADVQTDTNDIQGRLPAALVSGRIDASVGAMAANVMTAAAAASDLTTELQSGLATQASVDTIDDLLDTEIAAIKTDTAAILADTGTDGVIVATNNDKTGYRLSATGVDDILDESLTELAAVPAAAPTLRQGLQFLYQWLRNRRTTTSSATTIQNDAGTTTATATVSDDGTTATKGEYA